MKLAWLDPDRQLHLSGDRERPVFADWGWQVAPDLHSWPTWSPDGRSVAAFRTARDGSGSRVVVAGADRVSEAESPGRLELPLHLAWSPGGRSLAVLVQQQGGLLLERLDAADPERSSPVVEGAPLFHAWVDEDRLAVHVTESELPRVVVCGPLRRGALVGTPGPFTAPVVVGGQVVWVSARADGRQAIVVTPPSGTPSRELEVVEGFVAMVSGGGGALLRAIAQEPDGPYSDLRRIEVATGRSVRVADGDCLAFFPAGDRVVLLRRHPRRASLLAVAVGPSARDEQVLLELAPSRDLRFWVRFFEQFAASHPLVDPTGGWVALAGALPGAPDERPRIWLVPTDGSARTELGEGTFATFGVERPPPPVAPRAPSPLES